MGWDGDERPRSLALPWNLDLFPATACLVVAAVGITIGKEIFHKDVSALVAWVPPLPDGSAYDRWFLLREPWRLLSTVLPHGGWIHLLFNSMWMVDFGKLIEGRYGSARALGIFAFFALVSSAAQVGISGPGIGLSGVLYGCFGFLAVMSRFDTQELHGRMPRQTEQLLIGWFFLCVVLTWMGAWNIGNTAHGYGGLIGALLGMVVVSGAKQRPAWIGGLAAATVLALLSCTVAYPFANLDWFWATFISGAP